MQTADAAVIVQQQIESYNARDLDRTIAYYAPDAVRMDNEGTVLAKGREAIRDVFAQVFAQNPALHADVPIAFQVGEWVATHSIVPEWAMRDGSRGEMQWVEVYRVVGSKIQRVHRFH